MNRIPRVSEQYVESLITGGAFGQLISSGNKGGIPHNYESQLS
jgi:hypothetical protein